MIDTCGAAGWTETVVGWLVGVDSYEISLLYSHHLKSVPQNDALP